MSELTSVIDALACDDVHLMADSALLARTEGLLVARNKLDAEIERSLQAADSRGSTVAECGRQSRGWLIEEEFLSPKEAGRRLWLARRLPAFPMVAAALADGAINLEHARIIIDCLGKLASGWREAAQPELVAFAREHDPAMLAQLCRELRVRTGADEDAEAAAERKYAGRHLSLNSTFDGMVHIDGMLDAAGGAIVKAAINALAAGAAEGDDRSVRQRYADALVELAQRALTFGELPDHCGDRPQVAVTIPLNELRDGLATGETGNATLNGQPITPATARMFACDAGIIPAVLGGAGEVLDLGRSQRTWSRAQRRAARLRDKGCVWPGCQAGLDRCHLHHVKFWTEHHGPTDTANGAHVCYFHHWLVHHTKWKLWRDPCGRIRVRRD
jgi:hypothetical protein